MIRFQLNGYYFTTFNVSIHKTVDTLQNSVTSKNIKGQYMTLQEYFKDKPRGAQSLLAKQLGISKTWLSLILTGKRQPSPRLAMEIERHTLRSVKRVDLLPELFSKAVK
jgi:DNA-binding transcriptional regulator YdaS (Cro superfamily)